MPATPKDFATVTPFIMAEGVEKVIDFLKKAFDAEENMMLHDSQGRVWHCQLKIGDSMVMLADTMGMHEGTSSCLYLYVDDADAAYKKALAAGGKEFMPPRDEFYGDRSGGVTDPAGNYWFVATNKEDLSFEEIERRARVEEARRKAA